MGYASQFENDLEKNSDSSYMRATTRSSNQQKQTQITALPAEQIQTVTIPAPTLTPITQMQEQAARAEESCNHAPPHKQRGKLMRFLFGRLGEVKNGRYF